MSSRTANRVPAVIAAAAWLTSALGLLLAGPASAAAAVPRFSHVVIVVIKNKNYNDIIGRPDETPYLNSLASNEAVFSQSYAITHPSQPNYLALFSKSTQGVTDDDCPHNFTGVPSLGAELISAGQSFAGYSESIPSTGYTS